MELYLTYNNLFEIISRNAKIFPERVSHKFRTSEGFVTRTWKEFYGSVRMLAAGFCSSGVDKGSHAAFFSDNRYEWAMTDYALLSIGAVSVPRGSDTTPVEQKFIYQHSDSRFLIMENLERLSQFLSEFRENEFLQINKIFIMDENIPGTGGMNILNRTEYSILKKKIIYYNELISLGKKILEDGPGYINEKANNIQHEDIATIIYTSGTSGNPKGVMLTNGNFLSNVKALSPLLGVDINNCEKTISILPSWHVYERTFEYCTGASGMTLVYSSIKSLTEDLASEKPTIVASVPRVWESFYNKIMDKIEKQSVIKKMLFNSFLKIGSLCFLAQNKINGYILSYKKMNPLSTFITRMLNKLLIFILKPFYLLSRKVFKPIRDIMGGNLRASFSGGGSLPPYVDLFFNTVGITLVNAYGMTETSPGTITRRLGRNTIGSIGIPIDDTEVRIINENGEPAEFGEKGLIHIRGPQVMKGYYKNPEATAAVLSGDGWINTGDIGIASVSGDYTITGRAKSTIVLIGGENIEPEPIEEKLEESIFIEHAVVMGQDKKWLVALIAINEEKIRHFAEKWKISWDEMISKGEDIIRNSRIVTEIRKEIKRLINRENGFKTFEQIRDFIILKKNFTVGEELTQTLKVKRKYLEEKYQHHLENM